MRRALKGMGYVLGAAVALVLLCLLPLFVLTPRAPKPPTNVRSVAALREYLQTLTDRETPPALGITVIRDGKLVFDEAFGKADGPKNLANSPEAIYHFWSVTKLLTATAIMQLVEDGRVGLDDPVTRYLPDFATRFSNAPTPITVRQLLQHDSGMQNLRPDHLIGWIHHLNDRPIDESALVASRMGSYQALAAAPGKVSAYSNAGYIVLGAIVEKVSGQHYEDFVRERILGPLGMTRTDFIYRDDLLPRAVAGSHPLFHVFTPFLMILHRDWFDSWVAETRKQRMWLVPLYPDYTAPTGLIGSGRDLARFGQAFLNGGEIDGIRILARETVSQMLDQGYGGHTGPDHERMGLGWHWWDTDPLPFKGHGGDGPGFTAQLAIFPDQNMVVVVLANDMLTDRLGLTRLVAAVFGSPAP